MVQKLKPNPRDLIPLAPALLTGGEAERVKIIRGGTIFAEIPLPADTTFRVKTDCGHLIVQISGNSARVKSSTCPKKLCVRTGKISSAGSAVVCAPGKTAVILEGEGEYDAVTE